MIYGYYSAITLISVGALAVLCILVYDNKAIKKKQKLIFYYTYLLIAASLIAEWLGQQLNGNDTYPSWLLLSVKCFDYIVTPMVGAALVKQTGIRNKGTTVINYVLIGNTVFQIVAAFFGWMTVIDIYNLYYHGPLYFVYIILYSTVVLMVLIEFMVYSRKFSQQNRYSLYSVMFLVSVGVLLQELLGSDFRTSHISIVLGAILLFIHYIEFAQIDAEDHINRQRELLRRDSLTDLLSRYAYTKQLNKYNKMGSLPENLIAFSIDINGLKVANDTLGHAAGDELICGAADCIHSVFSCVGLCFRTGGDEFAVFANTDLENAKALIGQLNDKANAWSGNLIHHLELSAGYAAAAEHKGVSIEKLMVLADKNMYIVKNKYYEKFEERKNAYAFSDE